MKNRAGAESASRSGRKKHIVKEWAQSLIIALLLAVVIRIFVVEPYKIPTGSMRTTLMEGDIILVNKFIYGARIPFTGLRLPGLRKPERGDVIVFIYPVDKKKNFVKRLIGLPGDALEIKDGSVYVNGSPLAGAVFNKRYYYNRGPFGKDGETIIVPKDSYFVLGDNSANSQDSRYWGFVPAKNLVGRAILIYFPPKRIRMIK